MSDYLDELHHACFRSSGTTSVRVRALRQGIREIIALRKLREAAEAWSNTPVSRHMHRSEFALLHALEEARKEGA